MEVSITVDLWCKYKSQKPPAYRLYVNNELLTERTFLWDQHINYLTEHLIVEVDRGVHELRLEPIDGNPTTEFTLENMHVNGRPAGLKFRV